MVLEVIAYGGMLCADKSAEMSRNAKTKLTIRLTVMVDLLYNAGTVH
jgi:hypothetical protein